MKNIINITENITETDIIKRQRLIILYELKKDMGINNLTKKEQRRFIRHYIKLNTNITLKKQDSEWIIEQYKKTNNLTLKKFLDDYVQIHTINNLTEYSEISDNPYETFRPKQLYYTTQDKENAIEIYYIPHN